jgi:hypothetical protein
MTLLSTPPAFPTTTCPHCGVELQGTGQFCESCGKALPSASPTGPSIVAESAFAQTPLGQQLQSEDLKKQAGKASKALLAVAIIQTLVAGVVLLIASNSAHSAQALSNPALAILVALAAIFWGIYGWACIQPLPAAIVGLALYSMMVTINVVLSLKRASNGGSPHGIGIGVIDIVILACLARGITAGIQYRKLTQKMN